MFSKTGKVSDFYGVCVRTHTCMFRVIYKITPIFLRCLGGQNRFNRMGKCGINEFLYL